MPAEVGVKAGGHGAVIKMKGKGKGKGSLTSLEDMPSELELSQCNFLWAMGSKSPSMA